MTAADKKARIDRIIELAAEQCPEIAERLDATNDHHGTDAYAARNLVCGYLTMQENFRSQTGMRQAEFDAFVAGQVVSMPRFRVSS